MGSILFKKYIKAISILCPHDGIVNPDICYPKQWEVLGPISARSYLLPTQNSVRVDIRPKIGWSIDLGYFGRNSCTFLSSDICLLNIILSWLQAWKWNPEQRTHDNRNTQHNFLDLLGEQYFSLICTMRDIFWALAYLIPSTLTDTL